MNISNEIDDMISSLGSMKIKFQTLASKAQADEQKIVSLFQEINDLKKDCLQLHRARDECNELANKNEELSYTVSQLKLQLKSLEDENNNFKKVSQIIAYEKENSKLKTYIKQLEDKITKQQPNTSNNTDQDQDQDVSVYEKKINKIVYYVADDDTRRIFQKLPDGEVGEELGYLALTDGKLKPVWLKVNNQT